VKTLVTVNQPLFHQSIAFTAAKTGFNVQVIDKNYFCSVLLEDLARHGGAVLLFYGGTRLAKVHAGFYRLNENPEVAIPMHVNTRSKRPE
jgi:hypothetical protein